MSDVRSEATAPRVYPWGSIFSEKIYDETVGDYAPRGKSAIIFDDYRPEHQQVAYGAVEAAAEMGGLVIMTSNHPDPFRLLAAPKQELNVTDLAVRMMVERENPEALERADKASEERYSEISASLASRMAAMFKLVHFSGEDYRMKTSPWD